MDQIIKKGNIITFMIIRVIYRKCLQVNIWDLDLCKNIILYMPSWRPKAKDYFPHKYIILNFMFANSMNKSNYIYVELPKLTFVELHPACRHTFVQQTGVQFTIIGSYCRNVSTYYSVWCHSHVGLKCLNCHVINGRHFCWMINYSCKMINIPTV